MRENKYIMAHWKVQSVLVPKSWTKAKADTWVRAHGYKLTYYGKRAKIEGNNRRYRQLKPDAKKRTRTISLPNGVKLVEFVM